MCTSIMAETEILQKWRGLESMLLVKLPSCDMAKPTGDQRFAFYFFIYIHSPRRVVDLEIVSIIYWHQYGIFA